MPQQVLILDSTQISSAYECIQMWNLGYEKNYSLSLGAPNDPMAMGSLGHKYLEIFYKRRAERKDISNSMEEALAFNPDYETCKCGHAKEDHIIEEFRGNDGESAQSRCKRCLPLKAFHNPEWVIYPLDKDKRQVTNTRIREYIYKYVNSDFIPRRPEDVEVGFSYPLLDTPDKLYILEGKIDLITNFAAMDTYVDHKCQLRKSTLYPKAVQFKNYALVTGFPVACINYIRLTQKIDSETYERKFISFTKPELEFWKRRLINFYDRVVKLREEGITPNDYNWGMCSGKFGHPCQFTQVCEEVYNPAVAESKLAQNFHVRTEWKPW